MTSSPRHRSRHDRFESASPPPQAASAPGVCGAPHDGQEGETAAKVAVGGSRVGNSLNQATRTLNSDGVKTLINHL